MQRQSFVKYFLDNTLKQSDVRTSFISYNENLFIAAYALRNFLKMIDSRETLTALMLIKSYNLFFIVILRASCLF